MATTNNPTTTVPLQPTPGSSSAGGGSNALEASQGHDQNPAPADSQTLTFTLCGAKCIKSTDTDEWYNEPLEYWWCYCVAGGKPASTMVISTYQNFVPIEMRYRMFNIQATGEGGPTQFTGLQAQVELLSYIDHQHLFGPCAEAPNKTKAFSDIFCNERSLHNGYDKDSVLFYPTPVKLARKGWIHPFETSSLVRITNCNAGEELVYEYKAGNRKLPRHIVEWDSQCAHKIANESKSPFYTRFDYFGCRKYCPWRDGFSKALGRRTLTKYKKFIRLPGAMLYHTWQTGKVTFKKLSLDQKTGGASGRRLIDVVLDSEEKVDYENYRTMACAPDVAEHNPMPMFFYKLNTMVGPQGNKMNLTVQFNWEIEYTFRFQGRNPEGNAPWFPTAVSRDQNSGRWRIPKQPYAIPVFNFVNTND